MKSSLNTCKKSFVAKKLLLWKHILVSLGYGDAKIVDDIVAGFSLTGWAHETGGFDKHVRAASMTVQQLEGIALGLNSAVVGTLMKGPWTPLDADALEETVAEVDKGWLAECKDVDLNGQFIAKRFPIQQKSKIRLIDDFSVFGVNSTVACLRSLGLNQLTRLWPSFLR